MKTLAKTSQIIIWSMTLAAFNLLAAKEPLYEGLGSYSRKVTTKSAEAQRYFDQGLGFLHGFNHRAAIRAFQQAAARGGMHPVRDVSVRVAVLPGLVPGVLR